MNIEIRSLKTNLAFSEETTMFTAYVFIDGVKVGYAQNDGRGGDTYIQAIEPYDRNRKLIQDAEEYCKTLPPETYEYNGTTRELTMRLDFYIDKLVDKSVMDKQYAKDFKKGICYTKCNDAHFYKISTWKNCKLADMFMTPLRKLAVINYIKELKADGYTILNTNLPQDILDAII